MKKLLLNLMGWSEVQWEWKKRRWRERGFFPSLAALVDTDYPALYAVLFVIAAAYVILIFGGSGNPLDPTGSNGFIQSQYGFAIPSLIRAHGESWRLVTAVFVHYSLLHILFNCVALYQVGHYLEEEYGSARFFIVFLVTGIAGNALQFTAMSGNSSLGGASGGVFGLIGFCGLHAHLARHYPLRSVMLRWAFYSFLFGLFMGAANLAHFGGFASGAVLALVVPVYRQSRRMEVTFFRAVALAAWLLVAISTHRAFQFSQGSAAWNDCAELLEREDWDRAVKPCKRAMELLPNYSETRQNWETLQDALSQTRPVIDSF